MSKPFEPTWACVVKIGTKWYCHPRHRFWFKHDADVYVASRHHLPSEYIVIKDAAVEATLMLLNGA